MGFDIFVDPLQGAVFMICILGVPITTGATLRRFHGTKSSGRRIGWENWFALLALLSFWVHAATALWTVVTLNGRGRFKAGSLPADQIVTMSIVGYVMQLNFPFNPAFAKLSLLVLYFRVFSVNTGFKRWIWTLSIVQIAWLLAVLLCRIMFCLPIYKLWYTTTPGTCINPSYLLAAGEAINAAIAFIMIAMAMWMVRTLSMSTTSKRKLRILFILGGLNGVVDIIMIIEAYGQITVNLVYFLLLTIQMAVNCVCCCAPVYKTIFPDLPLLQRLRSKISMLYGSRSKERSHENPMETIVTIGGNVVKRGIGNDRRWGSLNVSGIGTRVDSDSVTQFVRCADVPPPPMDWKDVSNTADVGPGLVEGQPPWFQTRRNQDGQGVYIQRSFEVV